MKIFQVPPPLCFGYSVALFTLASHTFEQYKYGCTFTALDIPQPFVTSYHLVHHKMMQPSSSQISSHSSLSGALTPRTWPLYHLPQRVYNQNVRTSSSRSANSILFHQRNGTSWVPLLALRTNHKDLADAMVGGWDLVFPSRSSIQTQINFSITVGFQLSFTLFSFSR